ncbi:porin [Thioalkalivibrio sp. ALJ2]|uniref:porin n=1 Tax=Thioalkalivibrio sp. ALJ2 TaxID=1261622 RepID=UPI00037AECA4|nr:porin [Thioalkalivibrio sp. ALJ2]
MKKQILAVAVAGAFAVPAFAAADSSVTLFGQLQTQVVHTSSSGGSLESGFRQYDAGGIAGGALSDALSSEFGDAPFGAGNFAFPGGAGDGAGPNRLGVNVNHDLGNGLTALAKFEGDFQTGAASDEPGFESGMRDIYVGLRGDFGQVIAGRMTSSYNTAGKDPLNATFMQGRTNGARLGGLGGFGNGGYVERGIRYSNSFGIVGLDVGAFIDNNDDSDTAFSARVNIDLDPVELYVAHADYGDFQGGASTQRNSKIGVDWSTGPFRVVGEVEDFKYGEDGLYAEGNTYFLSGTYTMGRNDFVLNLGHTRRDSIDGNSIPNTDYAAIAVKHSFSNRVMAFAGVGYNSTDDLGYRLVEDDGVEVIEPTGRSLSFTGVGAGMRVSF